MGQIARAGIGALVLYAAVPMAVWAQGSPIIVAPPAEVKPANVTVNITPPPPDPKATQAMMDFVVANTEFNHASVPVTWATDLLKGANIWTRTPTDLFDQPIIAGMRNSAKIAALSLFLLGILWTGSQLVLGSALGTTSYQQLLPAVIGGFLLAMFADSIAHKLIDLSNWLCGALAAPSLVDFTGTALDLPPQPDTDAPGVVKIPASFFSGLLTSLIYAVVLIILELKLIFRAAILVVTDVVMPISGALWAFGITRGWGVQLFRMFFGWLFGQALVVVCLALASSLLTLLGTDGVGQVLVKIAILFVALKAVSLLSGASLGGGGMFGLAGLMFLLRRAHGLSRRAAVVGGGGQAPAAPAANAPTVQPGGPGGGTGDGSAATGRPWRPATGTT